MDERETSLASSRATFLFDGRSRTPFAHVHIYVLLARVVHIQILRVCARIEVRRLCRGERGEARSELKGERNREKTEREKETKESVSIMYGNKRASLHVASAGRQVGRQAGRDQLGIA